MGRKGRDDEVIEFIFSFWKKNNSGLPPRKYIAECLNMNLNTLGRTIIRLMDKEPKFLQNKPHGDFELTEGAIQYFEEKQKSGERNVQFNDANLVYKKGIQAELRYQDINQNDVEIDKQEFEKDSPIQAIELPLYGQVRAGKGIEPDDLVVDMHINSTITIPDIHPGKGIFSLEVIGDSMVNEHILMRDIVIVEKAELGEISEGDLVVTYYLKEEFNNAKRSDLAFQILINSNFGGPVLKYFSKGISDVVLPSGQREPIYLLSVRKGKELAENKKNTIQTRYLNVIGKVIAVYRKIEKN